MVDSCLKYFHAKNVLFILVASWYEVRAKRFLLAGIRQELETYQFLWECL